MYEPKPEYLIGDEKAKQERTKLVMEVLKDIEEKKRIKTEEKGKRKPKA